MKSGHESQTAIMVCAARAAAHGRTEVSAFADPVAIELLPEEARKRVERFRAGLPPSGMRERLQHKVLEGRYRMMVPRTVAIDEVIRDSPSSQLVILGAGLDGRAWRMPELADVTVFEVDHPDSQATKRARIGSRKPTAREVRFVPVDFTRDRLDDALAAAGHDPEQQTTWVWEGVVMYLRRADIEATLRVIEARSTPNSRLVIAYTSPSIVRWVVGLLLRLVGEPFRSSFTADDMRGLLAAFGFTVVRDEDLATIAGRLSAPATGGARLLKDMRIVTALAQAGER